MPNAELPTASSEKAISGAEVIGDLPPYSPEEEKAVLRKIDRNFLPLLFVLYSLSVLDRSNLGNAKVAGMEEDLRLSGNRYSWLATIFYIGYILFQFQTTGWKLFPAHMWITFAVFAWGLISTMQAVITSWQGMMVCRFLLGAAEAAFGPGVPLYLSYFYPREKIGFRVGIFQSASALANAYGGALAFGISHIHSDIASWRLLFIIEGVPTCLLGIVAWFYCPDSPGSARFLNNREKLVAKALAQRQPGDFENQGLQLDQLFDAFRDYKSYCHGLINFGCNVSFASLPLFLPTIIAEMGDFTPLQSNGLSAPPYLLCFFVMIAMCFLSDRTRMRGPYLSAFAVIAAAGYIILATTKGTGIRYFGIFLAVNIFVSVGMIQIWVANSHSTDSKRAGGYMILQMVGQCGPFLGTNIFPPGDEPYYRKGMWVCAGFCIMIALVAAALSLLFWLDNRRKDRLCVAEGVGNEILARVDVSQKRDRDNRFRHII